MTPVSSPQLELELLSVLQASVSNSYDPLEFTKCCQSRLLCCWLTALSINPCYLLIEVTVALQFLVRAASLFLSEPEKFVQVYGMLMVLQNVGAIAAAAKSVSISTQAVLVSTMSL